MINAQCGYCTQRAQAGEDLAECACPADKPAEEDEDDVYYQCPIRFVPENILQWWEIYQYEKEFGANIDYMGRSIKYLEALRIYRHFINYWQELKNPPKPGELRRGK